MKKQFLFGAALLALFASSCSNSEDIIIDKDTDIVTLKPISLNATINNGTSTRLTYDDQGPGEGKGITVAWSKNESFTLYQGTSSQGSLFTNSADATGTFTGKPLEAGSGKYYAVYGKNITNDAGTLTIDITNQTGTADENGMTEFMLATADALTSETILKFDHKLTVLKMTLTLPSDVTGSVNKVTVSGLHNKATYDLSKTTDAYAYADDNKGIITATNGTTGFTIVTTVEGETTKKSFTAYVAVFPESFSSKQITIKATVGDNEYSYTIESERTLPENQVVPVNVTLTKRNLKSAYSIEDYFCWDAYTYLTNGSNSFSENNYGYHTGESVTAEHSCASCPTANQMKMYLGAGVYWDEGSTSGDGYYDGNVQTYKLPDGKTYHTGLWLMKKAYIGLDVTGTDYAEADTSNNLFKKGRPAAGDIDKYFFLPAAGGYTGSKLSAAGFNGTYWSSSSDFLDDYAYCLSFNSSYAGVHINDRYYGFLPMAAE